VVPGAFVFTDRRHAGKQLAAALAPLRQGSPLVLAVPRGGVPVAFEVACALDAHLDIVVARKLGAPGQHELGLGAIVDSDHPQSVLNDEIIRQLEVSPDYLQAEIEKELVEIRRRQDTYRKGRSPVQIVGRTVILIDDGIATGGSIRAALRGLRRMNPSKLVLAVPVAPPETVQSLRAECDEIVCLETPEFFFAIGEFYQNFSQTTDEEVIELLEAAAQHSRGAGTCTKPPSAARR
jgi:putative phosphoribosyl transferase